MGVTATVPILPAAPRRFSRLPPPACPADTPSGTVLKPKGVARDVTAGDFPVQCPRQRFSIVTDCACRCPPSQHNVVEAHNRH